MKSWTREETVFTKEQEEQAPREYERLGSVHVAMRRLEYFVHQRCFAGMNIRICAKTAKIQLLYWVKLSRKDII